MAFSLTSSTKDFVRNFLGRICLAGGKNRFRYCHTINRKSSANVYIYQQAHMCTQWPLLPPTDSNTLTSWKQQYIQDNHVTRKQLKPDNHVISETLLHH